MNLILDGMYTCLQMDCQGELCSKMKMWLSDLDIAILNMNLPHILNENISNCFNQYFSVFVSFSTKIQYVCKCFSMSCFYVLQNTSCWCGVPARTKEGSVPAGQSTCSEGGWPSAGLWLESAKEIQSKTMIALNCVERNSYRRYIYLIGSFKNYYYF